MLFLLPDILNRVCCFSVILRYTLDLYYSDVFSLLKVKGPGDEVKDVSCTAVRVSPCHNTERLILN